MKKYIIVALVFCMAVMSVLLYMKREHSNNALTDVTNEELSVYCKALEKEHIAKTTMECEGNPYATMYVDNEIILEVEEGVTQSQVEHLLRQYHGKIVGNIAMLGHYQVELTDSFNLDSLSSIITEIKSNDLISDAYLNIVSEITSESMAYNGFPNDDWGKSSWSEATPDGNNWGLEAIKVPSAWKLLIDTYGLDNNGGYSNIPSVNIGVIDSMFDLEHPDLSFKECWGFKKNKADSLATENTRQLASVASNYDEYEICWHGTHVAGIIAANANNKTGITGIALNNSLYGVSICDESGQSLLSLYNLKVALQYLVQTSTSATDKKIVINYSRGDNFRDYPTSHSVSAIEGQLQSFLNKGYNFVIVATAGNEGVSALDNSVFTRIRNPVIKSHIIVVGQVAKNNNSGFRFVSHEGPVIFRYGKRIDLAAPGDKIYSTVPPNPNSWGSKGEEYNYGYGTSQAAPHVSGVAALVWSADPALTGAEVAQVLRDSAIISLIDDGRDASPEIVDGQPGIPHKMIDAQRAVELALHSISGTVVNAKDDAIINSVNLTLDYALVSEDGNTRERKTATVVSDGRFTITIPEKAVDMSRVVFDSLTISCEGFHERLISLEDESHKAFNIGQIELIPDLPLQDVDVGSLPELEFLNELLLYTGSSFQDLGQYHYDSSETGINILDSLVLGWFPSTLFTLDTLEGMREKIGIVTSWDILDDVPIPDGLWELDMIFGEEQMDWILKNILNVSDETIELLKAECKESPDKHWYYYDNGYCYFRALPGGELLDIPVIVSAKYDGFSYYIVYDALFEDDYELEGRRYAESSSKKY